MHYFKNEKFKIFLIPALILAGFAFLALFSDSVVGQSPDAIGLRVIPNPNHYSALRWYKDKGFTGSPQSLLVDGYEAVRDGRTVYVNAANVLTDTEVLYTNIYIISYNQEAENPTNDIFSQILRHWKFNSNLPDPDVCAKKTEIICLVDSDCPLNDYCLSRKGEATRDTRRLADLAEIKTALEAYRNKHNKYPALNAGSYLPNKTLSVWPSWQKLLAQELALVPLPVDPVNELGVCGERFNQITCWDEKAKEFADADPADPNLNLPDNSQIYVYVTDKNGSSYWTCGVMESDYVHGAGSGNCNEDGSPVGANKYTDNINNNPPVFTASSLRGYTGRPYEGYIAAYDPDGDPLAWSVNTGGTNWNGWQPGAPTMESGAVPYQIKLKANAAGPERDYNFTARIDDGRGGIVQETFTIKILNPPPDITVSDAFYNASTTNPLNHVLYASGNSALTAAISPALLDNWEPNWSPGNNLTIRISGPLSTSQPILSSTPYSYTLRITNAYGAVSTADFVINVINNPPFITVSNTEVVAGSDSLVTNPIVLSASDLEHNNLFFTLNGSLPPGLSGSRVSGTNTFRITVTPSWYNAADAFPSPRDTPDNIYEDLNISVRDDYQAVSDEDFIINVINHPPRIDPISAQSVRTGNPITPFNVTATDPDGHTIVNYRISGASYGLTINSTTGRVTGTPTSDGSIQIIVRDYFGAESQSCTFNFSANSYCGDGVWQSTNGEGVQEECDGESNTTDNPGASRENRQYDCTDTCLFTGGWCGDGNLYDALEDCDDPWNVATRPEQSSPTRQYDCTNCIPSGGFCGNNNIDGPETCDGTDPDGIANNPADSSPTRQYACTACTPSGGYCGDGDATGLVNVQTGNGETCDFGGDNSCCNRCALTCPPYSHNPSGDLTFGSARTSSITLTASNPSTYINFPVCRSVVNNSANINIQVIPPTDKTTSIVFVTDTSCSMGPNGGNINIDGVRHTRLDWAKLALKNALEQLHIEASQSSRDGVINTGLIEFDNRTTFYPISDIKSDLVLEEMKNTIDTWRPGDACYTYTSIAVQNALDMLNMVNNDYKFIIILSDGAPNASYYPVDETNNAKTAGIKIFSIAFIQNTNANEENVSSSCSWSSDCLYIDPPPPTDDKKVCANPAILRYDYLNPDGPCGGGPYSYRSEDIVPVYEEIIEKIFPALPTDITLNVNSVPTIFNYNINTTDTIALNSFITDCQSTEQQLNINISPSQLENVQVVLSSFFINYCPLCN